MGARAVQISKQTEERPPLIELTLAIPRYPCRNFADRLRQYRREQGWRQADLARVLLVFPSQTGTPLYPKNIRRRHFIPALQALGIVGIRQHDLRRSFVAIHVEAGTHPKLVQERVGHSSIALTMDVYGKIAEQMALTTEQEARFEALAAKAIPAPVPVEPTGSSGAETTADVDRTLIKSSDS